VELTLLVVRVKLGRPW